jgi:hypothetical protein
MKTKTKTPVVRKHTRREPVHQPVQSARREPVVRPTASGSETPSSGWSWEILVLAAFLVVGFAAVVILFFIALKP